MSDSRAQPNPRGPEPIARPSRTAGLALYVSAAAGLFLSGFIAQWLFSAPEGQNVQLRLLLSNLCYYLPFVVLPLALYVRRRPGVGAALRPNPISPFSVLLIVALALMGVYFANGVSVLWAIPLQELGLDVGGASLPIPGDSAGLMLCVLSVAALPAVCEEFLFRGAVLASLEEGGSRRAALVSAALFMLLHGSLVGMPAQFLLGLVLAALTLYCDSIYAALIYHTVHNAASILLQFLQQSAPEAAAAAPVRYLEAIGGAQGVLALAFEILFSGWLMLLLLRLVRMRARLRGVTLQARKRAPLRRREWMLLLVALALATILYAQDLWIMLGL